MTDKNATPKTRQIAYNPHRRRCEVVHPEDDLTGQTPITQHWSGALGWVTIPENDDTDDAGDLRI